MHGEGKDWHTGKYLYLTISDEYGDQEVIKADKPGHGRMALTMTAQGASIGAQVGGPWGAAIGGAIGGIASAVGSITGLFGDEKEDLGDFVKGTIEEALKEGGISYTRGEIDAPFGRAKGVVKINDRIPPEDAKRLVRKVMEALQKTYRKKGISDDVSDLQNAKESIQVGWGAGDNSSNETLVRFQPVRNVVRNKNDETVTWNGGVVTLDTMNENDSPHASTRGETVFDSRLLQIRNWMSGPRVKPTDRVKVRVYLEDRMPGAKLRKTMQNLSSTAVSDFKMRNGPANYRRMLSIDGTVAVGDLHLLKRRDVVSVELIGPMVGTELPSMSLDSPVQSAGLGMGPKILIGGAVVSAIGMAVHEFAFSNS